MEWLAFAGSAMVIIGIVLLLFSILLYATSTVKCPVCNSELLPTAEDLVYSCQDCGIIYDVVNNQCKPEKK